MKPSHLASTLVAIALSLSVLALPASHADTPQQTCTTVETTRIIDGMIRTILVERCTPTGGVDGASTTEVTAVTRAGEALCILRAQLAGGDPEVMCHDEAANPGLTPALVTRAFQDTPLPPSVLQVQPPNGRTLVNFDTNFFTEAGPFTRVVTLLGRRVELRVFPVEFTWHFDDGATLTTTSPGTPYPDLDVTHDYGRTGTYTPRVDTTYGADWRLTGGAWQRVAGTVSVEGEVVELEAVEARPTLVR